jgi:hypothetical protein
VSVVGVVSSLSHTDHAFIEGTRGDMSDIINKALEVAEEYPVFPCDEKKRPIVQGGYKAATQDPELIERMFANPAAKLVGMPTGDISGLSVIDVDVRDGKQGKLWVQKNVGLLGITRIARTQSNGYHYYYKHKSGIRNRAGISNCIDVRGSGGYVIHPISDGYDWLNDEDFAEFPEKMARLASEPIGIGATGTEIISDAFGKIVDGREKQMAKVIMAIVAEFQREHGAPPTLQYVIDNGFEAYANSIDHRGGDLDAQGRGLEEFKRKALSTIERARTGRIADIDVAPPKPQNVLSQVTSETKSIERKIRLKTIAELKATPPPQFMVGDYLIENSFAVLYGAPASYKSFLALDWALSVAHGIDWNGRPTAKGAVVYLAMEGQSGITVRTEAWSRHRKLQNDNVEFYAVTTPIGMAMENAADILALKEAIDETLGNTKPKLICIDTLARSFAGSGAEENSATDMGYFIRSCDILREWYDCTVLAVHHSGKSGVDGQGLRGSSALLGAVDTSIAVKRRADTQAIELLVQKQKDVSEALPLWLEAKEVAFTQDAFAQEQSSLVLEVLDGEPEKAKQPSKDQKLALRVLGELIDAGTYFETDEDGDQGIPLDVWKAALERKGKKYTASGWSNFHKRMFTSGFVSIFNGLANET